MRKGRLCICLFCMQKINSQAPRRFQAAYSSSDNKNTAMLNQHSGVFNFYEQRLAAQFIQQLLRLYLNIAIGFGNQFAQGFARCHGIINFQIHFRQFQFGFQRLG